MMTPLIFAIFTYLPEPAQSKKTLELMMNYHEDLNFGIVAKGMVPVIIASKLK